ncbi:MAG TPA: ProQ/FINO family protein [Allosphingosinicella sp.]
MSYWVTNFRKLAREFPSIFPKEPTTAIPLLKEVDDYVAAMSRSGLSPAWIKRSLLSYRQSRPYLKAIAANRMLHDSRGQAVRRPTAEEQAEARTTLSAFSLPACLDKLRNPHCGDEEKKTALEMLEWDSERLRVSASRMARGVHIGRAMGMRRILVQVRETIFFVDPSEYNRSNVHVCRFFYNITTMLCESFSAQFINAKNHWKTACNEFLSIGPQAYNFFPNFFLDKTELLSYDLLLDSIESYAAGEFRDAAVRLQKWVGLNSSWSGRGIAHYDSAIFVQKVCEDLADLTEGTAPTWAATERLLDRTDLNIYRTARALWDRLEPLVSITRSQALIDGDRDRVREGLIVSATLFQLLSTSAPLPDNIDRSAGIEEEVRLPRMVDLLQAAAETDDGWQFLITQILRMSLMLRADYQSFEQVRRVTKMRPVPAKSTAEIESMNDGQLIKYVEELLTGNHPRSVIESWVRHWESARAQCIVGHRSEAISETLAFHARFRAVPHIIRVKNRIEAERRRAEYTYELERCWRKGPSILRIDSSDELEIGQYAYMQPRWGRNLKDRHHFAGEDPLIVRSRMPRWMDLFAEWSNGKGPVAPARLFRWMEQIEPKRRSVALRLLAELRYYDDDHIRNEWSRIFRDLVPAEAKTSSTLLVAAGGAEKSATHNAYFIRQALSQFPPSVSSIDTAFAFVRANGDVNYHKECTVIIFDDILGSGDTVMRFLDQFAAASLIKARLLVVSLVSTKLAKERLEMRLGPGTVITGRLLENRDKAFGEENTLWDNEEDRVRSRRWAEQIGLALGFSAEHALGWRGGEALIAFSYNIPNNSLPLLWGEGQVRGKPWVPLFTRYE